MIWSKINLHDSSDNTQVLIAYLMEINLVEKISKLIYSLLRKPNLILKYVFAQTLVSPCCVCVDYHSNSTVKPCY